MSEIKESIVDISKIPERDCVSCSVCNEIEEDNLPCNFCSNIFHVEHSSFVKKKIQENENPERPVLNSILSNQIICKNCIDNKKPKMLRLVKNNKGDMDLYEFSMKGINIVE